MSRPEHDPSFAAVLADIARAKAHGEEMSHAAARTLVTLLTPYQQARRAQARLDPAMPAVGAFLADGSLPSEPSRVYAEVVWVGPHDTIGLQYWHPDIQRALNWLGTYLLNRTDQTAVPNWRHLSFPS